jgi:DNA-directed RNA polymerase specialized sigma24 family protein
MEPAATKNEWVLTKEGLESLLAWLSPDPEEAARKYEEIRLRLIKTFVRRECTVAEELADETINRVIKKLPEIVSTYVGDRAPYFYAVAKNIFHEYLNRVEYLKRAEYSKRTPSPLSVLAPDLPELYLECLELCMENLDPVSRDFILKYFQERGQAKIKLRKELSERLGVNLSTLRVRAFRIKESLKPCVISCVKQSEAWVQ